MEAQWLKNPDMQNVWKWPGLDEAKIKLRRGSMPETDLPSSSSESVMKVLEADSNIADAGFVDASTTTDFKGRNLPLI